MSTIFEWLNWIYDPSTPHASARASLQAIYNRKASTMNPRDLPKLRPATFDEIMNTIRGDDADNTALLALARGIAAHVQTDEGDSKRRSFRVDGTIFVMRSTDTGLPGALWRLCTWLDQHRPAIVEPDIDKEATQPVDTIGGNV